MSKYIGTLKNKNQDTIYPRTKKDAIIDLGNIITADDSTPTDPTPVNADLLNNQPASYYATKGSIISTSDITVHLTNTNTVVISGTPTSVICTIDTPEQGYEFVCGLTFTTGDDFVFEDNAPTGFSIVWDTDPVWTFGRVYEILYRCLWAKDSNNNYIINATYNEVIPTGVS